MSFSNCVGTRYIRTHDQEMISMQEIVCTSWPMNKPMSTSHQPYGYGGQQHQKSHQPNPRIGPINTYNDFSAPLSGKPWTRNKHKSSPNRCRGFAVISNPTWLSLQQPKAIRRLIRRGIQGNTFDLPPLTTK